jgi:hypothetical protein
MNELLLTTVAPPTKVTETVLRKNFRPQGCKWGDEIEINFGNGDYIEVKMDLSGCSGINENIISIGDSIPNWNQYIGGYHAYYTVANNALEVNSLTSAGQEAREYAYPSDNTNVIMKINNEGVYVDGNLLMVANSRIGELNKIQIGSAEGNTRSNATYEYIKVVTV